MLLKLFQIHYMLCLIIYLHFVAAVAAASLSIAAASLPSAQDADCVFFGFEGTLFKRPCFVLDSSARSLP